MNILILLAVLGDIQYQGLDGYGDFHQTHTIDIIEPFKGFVWEPVKFEWQNKVETYDGMWSSVDGLRIVKTLDHSWLQTNNSDLHIEMFENIVGIGLWVKSDDDMTLKINDVSFLLKSGNVDFIGLTDVSGLSSINVSNGNWYLRNFEFVIVPEPSTLVLFLIACVIWGCKKWLRH